MFLNFQEEKVSAPPPTKHLLSCSLHRATPDQAGLVTPWIVSLPKLLSMAVGCVKTRWHHNGALKPMLYRMKKNMTRFHYKFSCLCWKIALDIALLDVTSTSELTLREWPPLCSKLCRCVPSEKNSVTRWWLCSTKLSGKFALPLYCHCDSNYAGSSISDQNWVKNREAAARRVTLPRLHCTCKWTSEWMNTNLCSFALCQLVPPWFFQSKCSLLRKNPTLQRLCMHSALKFLVGTWMVPGKMIPGTLRIYIQIYNYLKKKKNQTEL